ncbi:amino acid ABC transporter substrate-binding protein [Limoniibacter endophyticus]|uniref:Amino acid ABC transporter substrate-binding protein n=1 Tax=Limoniibacter endophyticus TaxID=1565040 RepID=A0A8J3DLQ3_9HYPH|nr:amino acid ABC transporter substrate-binding protein [Limoniibacter endophyticus]GHC68520.1 amino acid ABC transporter substrate-binding protein [Limoniibacter endophyticus]
MKSIATLAGAAVLAVAASGASAATLDDVKARGELVCGTNTGLAGFAAPDNAGNWTGLDVDFCRAVAAAIFGDPAKVRFVPLSAKDRFTALQSGNVDLLSRNTTWTINRDTALGLNFVGVTYYDGQGFMVRKDLDVNSALELGGATVCVQAGTTTELNMADYFRANNLEYNPVVFEALAETTKAYEDGRCDAYTTDASGLYSTRLQLANPDDHVVLPDLISKEPLGPAVRKGDEQWFSVVKWTYFALLNAEDLGITQANVEEIAAKADASPEIKRVLGTEEGSKIGTDLGLENDWVVKIVKGVGNYGEIFERNVGQGSPLKIDRGLNKLWNKGGLQYGMPIR